MDNQAYAAYYADGRMAMWSVRHTRTECMRAAVRGMMGVAEFQDMINDSDRWNHCYKRGCRIKRVTVTEAKKP